MFRIPRTVSVTANGQLNVLRNLNLHHRRFIIDKLLDCQDDLINIFPVYLLAILKPLCHIVDELLRHLAAKLGTIVIGLDGDRVDIKAVGGRRRVGNFDGGEEVVLAHNLLALDELKFCILIPRINLAARFEVLQGILGS